MTKAALQLGVRAHLRSTPATHNSKSTQPTAPTDIPRRTMVGSPAASMAALHERDHTHRLAARADAQSRQARGASSGGLNLDASLSPKTTAASSNTNQATAPATGVGWILVLAGLVFLAMHASSSAGSAAYHHSHPLIHTNTRARAHRERPIPYSFAPPPNQPRTVSTSPPSSPPSASPGRTSSSITPTNSSSPKNAVR